jgi:crossover junction endodeoxyribonuclease RuvC
MSPTRRVLGVDPGLTATGYGIVDGDGVAAAMVASGVLRTSARLPRARRLAEICERVGALIDEYHPQDLAIEQHFVAENVRSAFAVGEARAAAMIAAAQRGLEVLEYPATTIKQTVTGSGAARKEQVQRMVVMHLALAVAPAPLDVSDALAVALTRLASLRMDALLAAAGAAAAPRLRAMAQGTRKVVAR